MNRKTAAALFAAQNAGRQKALDTGVIDYVDGLGMGAAKDALKESAVGEKYDLLAERAGAQTYPNSSHVSPFFMLEHPPAAQANSGRDTRLSLQQIIKKPYAEVTRHNLRTLPILEKSHNGLNCTSASFRAGLRRNRARSLLV